MYGIVKCLYHFVFYLDYETNKAHMKTSVSRDPVGLKKTQFTSDMMKWCHRINFPLIHSFHIHINYMYGK